MTALKIIDSDNRWAAGAIDVTVYVLPELGHDLIVVGIAVR
jgi:hypothetical protein